MCYSLGLVEASGKQTPNPHHTGKKTKKQIGIIQQVLIIRSTTPNNYTLTKSLIKRRVTHLEQCQLLSV